MPKLQSLQSNRVITICQVSDFSSQSKFMTIVPNRYFLLFVYLLAQIKIHKINSNDNNIVK